MHAMAVISLYSRHNNSTFSCDRSCHLACPRVSLLCTMMIIYVVWTELHLLKNKKINNGIDV